MDKIRFYWVDAFASRPFGGNRAAVCVFEKPGLLPDERLLQIAREMNLSETVFVSPVSSAGADYHIRWFTPEVEVPLCGHGTLAAAAVIFKDKLTQTISARFRSKSGILGARCGGGNENIWIVELVFPINIPSSRNVSTFAEQIDALGLEVSDVIAALISPEAQMMLLHIDGAERLKKISPDFSRLKETKLPERAMGIIVTARSEAGGCDFISRYFGPWEGLNEDPVTGSAHTVLAPYWAKLLKKNRLRAYQASQSGGDLCLECRQDEVLITGEAYILIEGTLFLR